MYMDRACPTLRGGKQIAKVPRCQGATSRTADFAGRQLTVENVGKIIHCYSSFTDSSIFVTATA